MLVIRRKIGEILLIGDDVEVEILECSHSQVKLGIRAPKRITILRKEIHLTGEQNRLASRTVSPAKLKNLLGHLR
jgi:carbon storage regulator